MWVESSVHSFHILEGIDLSSSEEEKAVEVRLKDVKILEDSLCNWLDLIGVLVGDKKEINPKGVTTHNRDAFEVESLSQPPLPQIVMLVVRLPPQARRSIIEAGSPNNSVIAVEDGQGYKGPG